MNSATLITAGLILLTSYVGVARSQDTKANDFSALEPLTRGVFANHYYPSKHVIGMATDFDGRKSFRLKKGIFQPKYSKEGYMNEPGAFLKSVVFSDLTRDGKKEAVVTVGIICNCTAVWYGIFVYSMKSGKPDKILWSFHTGDRGVGGLRSIKSRNSDMVIELYGWNSGPNRPPSSHIEAQAGSSYYTRRKYRWNGKRFYQLGKARILLTPETE